MCTMTIIIFLVEIFEFEVLFDLELKIYVVEFILWSRLKNCGLYKKTYYNALKEKILQIKPLQLCLSVSLHHPLFFEIVKYNLKVK